MADGSRPERPERWRLVVPESLFDGAVVYVRSPVIRRRTRREVFWMRAQALFVFGVTARVVMKARPELGVLDDVDTWYDLDEVRIKVRDDDAS